MNSMNTTTSATDDLEARLSRARLHLDVVAHHLAGPAPSADVLAAGYDTIGSVAQVAAALLRGEEALR